MAVGFQIVTIFANESSALARSVNSLVALAWPILVVLLARFARASYFDIADLANQDPLTGLPSRRQFKSIIEREIARQKRYGGVFSLAIMGFDNFKALNESRGYRVGDEALKVLAKLLRENTRRSDSIARLSGDEFAILLPNTRRADCTSLCNKLSIMIANRMNDEGIATSASVGGTTFENAPESTSEALQKADRAMSAIKADRKGYAAAVLTLAARRRRRQAVSRCRAAVRRTCTASTRQDAWMLVANLAVASCGPSAISDCATDRRDASNVRTTVAVLVAAFCLAATGADISVEDVPQDAALARAGDAGPRSGA